MIGGGDGRRRRKHRVVRRHRRRRGVEVRMIHSHMMMMSSIARCTGSTSARHDGDVARTRSTGRPWRRRPLSRSSRSSSNTTRYLLGCNRWEDSTDSRSRVGVRVRHRSYLGAASDRTRMTVDIVMMIHHARAHIHCNTLTCSRIEVGTTTHLQMPLDPLSSGGIKADRTRSSEAKWNRAAMATGPSSQCILTKHFQYIRSRR
mmetsp:Transcript_24630/g.38051  ORF Transcript_24630/g.38051 Transcript_24630/m.38051 type:complete len:203 (+) Transcript_24630:582-1190(+)